MKSLLALLGALFIAVSAQAADLPAAAPIHALDNGLLQVMHDGKATPFVQRYATLAPIVQQAFDLDTILQTSVGPRFRSFTPDQQQALQAEFLRFTVASYVSNFASFNGETFEIDPQTRQVGAEEVVATHFVPTRGDASRIDYVMRQGAAGWRAVDVLLDGSISRVAVQRSDFRSMVEHGGPDALVASLRKKVADLSGGVGVP